MLWARGIKGCDNSISPILVQSSFLQDENQPTTPNFRVRKRKVRTVKTSKNRNLKRAFVRGGHYSKRKKYQR